MDARQVQALIDAIDGVSKAMKETRDNVKPSQSTPVDLDVKSNEAVLNINMSGPCSRCQVVIHDHSYYYPYYYV